jgi:hypothetical protein
MSPLKVPARCSIWAPSNLRSRRKYQTLRFGSKWQAATLAPRPPFNARVETVTTKPLFREPFTPNRGLVAQSGARSLRHRDAIISLAARYKLPAVYSARDYASAGGLLSYGPDQIPRLTLKAGCKAGLQRTCRGQITSSQPSWSYFVG